MTPLLWTAAVILGAAVCIGAGILAALAVEEWEKRRGR